MVSKTIDVGPIPSTPAIPHCNPTLTWYGGSPSTWCQRTLLWAVIWRSLARLWVQHWGNGPMKRQERADTCIKDCSFGPLVHRLEQLAVNHLRGVRLTQGPPIRSHSTAGSISDCHSEDEGSTPPGSAKQIREVA